MDVFARPEGFPVSPTLLSLSQLFCYVLYQERLVSFSHAFTVWEMFVWGFSFLILLIKHTVLVK